MNVTINTESNNICAAACETINICVTADKASYTPDFGNWDSNIVGHSFKCYDKMPVSKSDVNGGIILTSTPLSLDLTILCTDIEVSKDKIYGFTWNFIEDGELKCYFYPIRIKVKSSIPATPIIKQNDTEVKKPCIEDGAVTLCYPIGDECTVSFGGSTTFVEEMFGVVYVNGTSGQMILQQLSDPSGFLAALNCGGLVDIQTTYGTPSQIKTFLIFNEHITSAVLNGPGITLDWEFLQSEICEELNDGTGGSGNGAGSSNAVGYNNYDDLVLPFVLPQITQIQITCFTANVSIGTPITPITDCEVISYDESTGEIEIEANETECCVKVLIEGESELTPCDTPTLNLDYNFTLLSTGVRNLLYEFDYTIGAAVQEVCVWVNGQPFGFNTPSDSFETLVNAAYTEVEVCFYVQTALCGYYGSIILPIDNTSPSGAITLTKEQLDKDGICVLPICDKYDTGNECTEEFCFDIVRCSFLPCGFMQECDRELDCERCYINPYSKGKKIYFQTQFLDKYSEDPAFPEGGMNEFLFFELYDIDCNLISEDITAYGQWMVASANGNAYQTICLDMDLMPAGCWKIKLTAKDKEGNITDEACSGLFTEQKECVKYIELRSSHKNYDCCNNWYGAPLDGFKGELLFYENNICIQGDLKELPGSVNKTRYSGKDIKTTIVDVYEMYMGCIDSLTHNYLKKIIFGGSDVRINNKRLDLPESTTFTNNLEGKMFNYNVTLTTECVQDNQC